ncbi:hypothetical protein ACX8XN_08545 [Calditrichota bacterium GD2]
MLTHDLQTLAEELYRPGDDAHTLAMRMLNYIEMSNYLDGGYSAANGGITSGGENSSSGGTVKMTSKTKYKLVPFYETQWIYWINYTQGTYSEDWLQALVYIGNGFIKYKVYEFEFIYYYNYGSSEAEQNQSCLIKIFGPKAKPTDSWLWRAFRGTGNLKEDIFNASMLSLTIPVATIGAAEATAYTAAEAPYWAAGWEAASAEMYSGWSTISTEAINIYNLSINKINLIKTQSLVLYSTNATAINNFVNGTFNAWGADTPLIGWQGYAGWFLGQIVMP